MGMAEQLHLHVEHDTIHIIFSRFLARAARGETWAVHGYIQTSLTALKYGDRVLATSRCPTHIKANTQVLVDIFMTRGAKFARMMRLTLGGGNRLVTEEIALKPRT